MLWKALSVHHNRCNAPSGYLWISQITVPLLWLSAFLHGQQGTLQRKFDVWSHFTTSNKVQIVVDASPWGIGGILIVDKVVKSYSADGISDDDMRILSVVVGDPAYQQVLETLAMLVALRTWADEWTLSRTTLAIKSDSITTLTLVMFCRAKGVTVGLLSREIALDIAESVYRPLLAEHIAGGANIMADALSRLFAPDKKQIPDFLSAVQKAKNPPRNNSFYRTLVHPVAAAWNDKHNAVVGGSVS